MQSARSERALFILPLTTLIVFASMVNAIARGSRGKNRKAKLSDA